MYTQLLKCHSLLNDFFTLSHTCSKVRENKSKKGWKMFMINYILMVNRTSPRVVKLTSVILYRKLNLF